jgi:hypothetical protein
MEQDVHLLKCLLHVLNVHCRPLHQHGSLAQVAPQDHDLIGGSKGASEQAEGVELLEPLAVKHIGLASTDVFDMARIDQQDMKAAFLKQLKERDPIDAG